ncbi:MAG: Ferrous iron transport protein B [Pelotomaculum sp. PtaU1.Bin035]|nr:MAG: Ferrous iron transport protein B [Pelotomaculum sp. PtaU1.Bin035]
MENDGAEKVPVEGKKIVLAGNPNVGKSVFFNILTGLYVDVSNYPGTTLDIACGRYGSDVVIDTPGVYGLYSFSEEEKVTRDIILAGDIVVNVVNSVQLERDLFLTMQIIDMGVPVVVALNMMDESVQEGLEIDIVHLEKLLGVPVIPTIAIRNIGIDQLKRTLNLVLSGMFHSSLPEELKRITPPAESSAAFNIPGGCHGGRIGSSCNPAGGVDTLHVPGGSSVNGCLGALPGTEWDSFYCAQRERVSQIVSQVVKEIYIGENYAAKLGRWMIQPATGFPLLILTLGVIYGLVGVFTAQYVVDFTEGIMKGYYEPAVRSLLGAFFPLESVVYTIFAGKYGVLTLTVTYLVGLLLPLVLGIFLVLSILEDSGYLPRIAALADRVLADLGLNGQAIIPLFLGFGCVTMACISTRILCSDRERRIVIFLLALGVPCSAQMAINMAVLASLSATYMFLYLLIMFSILLGAGLLLGRFLPGSSSPLLIELPPLRLPGLQNVWRKAWLKTSQFIKEAFPLFAGGTLFLSILEVTGLLQELRNFLAPVTVSWLRLPSEVADIFIMGFIRKEFGAAAIMSLPMLPFQKFVTMVTLSLTVPCIASTMVIIKERGWREGLFIWSAVFIMAFFTGGVLARLL